MSAAILAAIPLVPALTGGLLLLRAPGAERLAGTAAVLAALAATVLAWLAVASPGSASWGWFPAGLTLGLDGRGINGVFALLVAATGLLVLLYAARFMGRDEVRARFFGFMSLFLGAMLGLVLASDLMTLLITWELVGLCSYALIGYWHREADGTRDAARAFLTTRFADLGLYIAAMAAFAGGSLALDRLAGLPAGLRDLAAAGIVTAALCKSAQLPFSGWLRGAMSGPTPVSALLHSATMVAAGAILLIKVSSLIQAVGWAGPVVLWIGLATVLLGAVIALAQDDLKQLLAASTVSQYGYVFAGIGVAGTASASAYLVNHAAYKALLFLGAGVLILSGYHALSEMRGLRRSHPVLALLFLAGVLSLAALPPFGGYLAKDKLLGDVFEASPGAFWLLLLGAVLTAWYAGRAWLGTFAGPGRGEGARRPLLLLPIALLALASLVLGALVLPPVKHWWSALFPGDLPPFKTWELIVSAAAALLGLALAVAEHRGRLRLPPRLAPAALDWFGLPRLIDRIGLGGIGAARLAGRAGAALPQPARAGPATLAMARAMAYEPDAARTAEPVLALARHGRFTLEPALERTATGTAAGSLAAARGSDRIDRRVIGGAIARLDRALTAGSATLGRAQSGLLHHYYAGVAAGTALLLVLALLLAMR